MQSTSLVATDMGAGLTGGDRGSGIWSGGSRFSKIIRRISTALHPRGDWVCVFIAGP